jgi:glycosyltransferase involved in cell wall biosynthesis
MFLLQKNELAQNNPLVSVCIPSYNSAKYIEETIDWLLNQTYSNIEVIVVDDGSTDDSCHLFDRIHDKRFRYFTQLNRGASAARNAAFKHSKGEFIKFMDADDLVNSRMIESQVTRIKERRDCIASAKWGRFYKADASDFKLSPEKVWKDDPGIDWLINSLIDSGGNMMQPGIFLIPRCIVEKAGEWNESLSLIDDFEFMVRIISSSTTVLFCEDAFLMYRSGVSNSLSSRKTEEHMKSAFDSLKLGVNQILETKSDGRSKLACANTYQRWAYQFYPHHKELYLKAEAEIDNLGGANIQVEGGFLFTQLSKFIGWKNAILFKLFMQKKFRRSKEL